jgi:hypothetical protein
VAERQDAAGTALPPGSYVFQTDGEFGHFTVANDGSVQGVLDWQDSSGSWLFPGLAHFEVPFTATYTTDEFGRAELALSGPDTPAKLVMYRAARAGFRVLDVGQSVGIAEPRSGEAFAASMIQGMYVLRGRRAGWMLRDGTEEGIGLAGIVEPQAAVFNFGPSDSAGYGLVDVSQMESVNSEWQFTWKYCAASAGKLLLPWGSMETSLW